MLATPLRASLIELEHLLNGESYDAALVTADPVLNRIRQIMSVRSQGGDTGIADKRRKCRPHVGILARNG